MKEEIKTHWRQLVNPDYLGAYSLPSGKDITVKIREVKREIVKGIGGKQEECTVAHIENNKPLILNVTNSRMIQKIYGTPYIEEWRGKEITLYSALTKLKGEDVECLRIRPTVAVKPELKVKSKDFDNVVKAMGNGYTIDQVKQKFNISQEVEISLLEV